MIRHECGLLGIYGHEEAARLTYFGLYAQQHRGQESAGIVTIDEKGLLHEHKGMGLVPDVFAEANLQALPGTISLGHVRYSTTGRSAARNAQPFVAHYKGLDIAIAHNGNLVNTMELREELENDGAIFSTTNDTEVFMHLIVRSLREHDLVDAIREACARVRGAYCLLVYAGGTMVAVRDPHGFHPLALGRLDGAPVLASETCAFDLLEADYERPIQPGTSPPVHLRAGLLCPPRLLRFRRAGLPVPQADGLAAGPRIHPRRGLHHALPRFRRLFGRGLRPVRRAALRARHDP